MPDLESWSLPKALAEAVFTSELGHSCPASVTVPAPGSALLLEGREGAQAGNGDASGFSEPPHPCLGCH